MITRQKLIQSLHSIMSALNTSEKKTIERKIQKHIVKGKAGALNGN